MGVTQDPITGRWDIQTGQWSDQPGAALSPNYAGQNPSADAGRLVSRSAAGSVPIDRGPDPRNQSNSVTRGSGGSSTPGGQNYRGVPVNTQMGNMTGFASRYSGAQEPEIWASPMSVLGQMGVGWDSPMFAMLGNAIPESSINELAYLMNPGLGANNTVEGAGEYTNFISNLYKQMMKPGQTVDAASLMNNMLGKQQQGSYLDLMLNTGTPSDQAGAMMALMGAIANFLPLGGGLMQRAMGGMGTEYIGQPVKEGAQPGGFGNFVRSRGF